MSTETYYGLHKDHFYLNESCERCCERVAKIGTSLSTNNKNFGLFGLDLNAAPFFISWDRKTAKIVEREVPTNAEFFDLSSCVMVDNDSFVVCGGFRRADGKAVANVYRYTFSTHSFVRLPDLNTARFDFSTFFMGGRLFAVGGVVIEEEIRVRTNSCEMFNFKTMRWEHIADLSCARSGSVLFNYNKELFCVGGFSDQSRFVRKMEKYAEEENRWEVLDFKFPAALMNIQIYPAEKPNEVFIFGEYGQCLPSHIWKFNLLNKTVLFCRELSFIYSKMKTFGFGGDSIFCLCGYGERLNFALFSISNPTVCVGVPKLQANFASILNKVNCTKEPMCVNYRPELEASFLSRDYSKRLIFLGNLTEPFQLEINPVSAELEVLPIKTNLRLGKDRFVHRIASNKLFITGKTKLDTSPFFHKAMVYNLNTREVTKLPKMHLQKYFVSIEVLRDEVFVIGTEEVTSRGKPQPFHGEKYSLKTNKWEYMGKMNKPKSFIMTFSHKETIYVCGSTDDSQVIELFSNKKQRWEVCSMPDIRLCFGWNVVSFSSDIIAFDCRYGNINAYSLNIERGDLAEARKLQMRTEEKFNQLKVVTIDGKVYVIDYRSNKDFRVHEFRDFLPNEAGGFVEQGEGVCGNICDYKELFMTIPSCFVNGYRNFI